MRANEFILKEDQAQVDTDLERLKLVIGNKIKAIPQTKEAFKTLREIEDLLQHVHAGGRIGLINNLMDEIPDESVKVAHRELARYISSIDMTPEQRDDLFKRWKSDTLINHKLLLSPGRHAFSEIVNGYNDNPIIKELTNDLMRVEAYGHGKGEFLLNVFSKNISKPESNKGDLIINGKPIEIKTTDAGGARFGDQEVKPGDDYFEAVYNFKNTILRPLNYVQKAKSGINAIDIQALYNQSSDKKLFAKAITPVVKGLFPKADTTDCLNALFSTDSGRLRQAIAVASLENYMNQKHDYGVLYVDISRDPSIFIFFRNNEELNQSGFRLDISTQYLVTTDTQRVAAQFTVIPSGRLAAQQLSTIVPTKTTEPPAGASTYRDKLNKWVNTYATNRGVTDPSVISKIADTTTELLSKGYDTSQIVSTLEKTYKQSKKAKKDVIAPTVTPAAPVNTTASQQSPVVPDLI